MCVRVCACVCVCTGPSACVCVCHYLCVQPQHEFLLCSVMLSYFLLFFSLITCHRVKKWSFVPPSLWAVCALSCFRSHILLPFCFSFLFPKLNSCLSHHSSPACTYLSGLLTSLFLPFSHFFMKYSVAVVLLGLSKAARLCKVLNTTAYLFLFHR